MAAPERFAQMSDFPLATRAPSIHGTSQTSRDVRFSAAIGVTADIANPASEQLDL
jgi:hypothetical protein